MADNTPVDRFVHLLCADGISLSVSRTAIRQSGLINNLIRDLGLDDENASEEPIPLPNVASNILTLIITYCEVHKNDPVLPADQKPEITDWDNGFLDVDQYVLYQLVMAADYMDIKNLLYMTTKTIADMIKGKSTEEIRGIYNITNDFTPEEEAKICRENAWCEDQKK